MRALYLDCFSGVSGDMILGTLIDLGLPLETLNDGLGGILPRGARISARPVARAGLRGIQCRVHPQDRGVFRNLAAIESAIEGGRITPLARERSLRVIRALAGAEARLHGVGERDVHFHELGSIDTVADVVGACVGLEALGIDRLLCSPVNLGSGMVASEHGRLPIPSPAAAALLQGRSVYSSGIEGELATPTGAAILATLAEEVPAMPPIAVDRVGYGAGSRDFPGHPNLLRGFLGDLREASVRQERVIVVETTIDDMNPQNYPHLTKRLFRDGAFEVFLAPVLMKKGRPGQLLTVILPPSALPAATRTIFEESTTIGFRLRESDRVELDQEIVPVRTRFGPVNVKASSYRGEVMQVTPEFEDCRRVARERGVPLPRVQEAALSAYRTARGEGPRPARAKKKAAK